METTGQKEQPGVPEVPPQEVGGSEKPKPKTANRIGLIGQRVAKNVRSLRQVTIYALSHELKRLGHPIAPTGISKIESTGRQVTVDDLLALSVAMNVSPLRLLMPVNADEQVVSVTENTEAPARELWEFAAGQRHLSERSSSDVTHDVRQARDFRERSNPPEWLSEVSQEEMSEHHPEVLKLADSLVRRGKAEGLSQADITAAVRTAFAMQRMRDLVEETALEEADHGQS